MITIRTMKHIPTSRIIAGFRSTQPQERMSDRASDCQRMMEGYRQLLKQEHLRHWRNQMWQQRITRT